MAKSLTKQTVKVVRKQTPNNALSIPQINALTPKANYQQLIKTVVKGIDIIANNNLTKDQEKQVTKKVLDVFNNSEFKDLLDQLP